MERNRKSYRHSTTLQLQFKRLFPICFSFLGFQRYPKLFFTSMFQDGFLLCRQLNLHNNDDKINFFSSKERQKIITIWQLSFLKQVVDFSAFLLSPRTFKSTIDQSHVSPV